MKLAPACSLLLVSAATAAAAESPRYLDDRSDAAALVRSLYNAVSRDEYARAWSYFGAEKPAADLPAYAAGYDQTDSVALVTGRVSAETTPEGTRYGVPVALVAYQRDGTEKVFKGCYFARQAASGSGAAEFAPLQIERGELAAAEQPFEQQLPERCGDGVQVPADAVLDRARAAFAASHADRCQVTLTPGVDLASLKPDSFDLVFRYQSSDQDYKARLFRFYCNTGAYNESHVFYLHDDDNGLREAQFATPDVDIRYADDSEDAKVESVTVVGFHAESALVNSEYDPATQTLTSFSKWRGVGDASSIGTWEFREGQFMLVKYEVDASFDGEINPDTVVDYHTGP